MKKSPYFRIGVLLLIAGFIYSCVKDEMPATNETKTLSSMTLAEARGYFDAAAPTLRTRSDASSSDFETFFTLGDFNPDWAQGAISEHPDLASADIPAPSQYFYGVVYGEGEAARAYLINHDLLVVKDRTERLTPACYLRFFVPDSTCIEVYTAEVCATLLHSEAKTIFSGVAIYTTLEGMPVGVDSYSEGCLVDGVFLGDTTLLWEARCEKLLAMMPDVLFLRCKKQDETRGGYTLPQWLIDWPIFGGDISPVVCNGTRPPRPTSLSDTKPIIDDGQTPPNKPSLNNIVGTGGGGYIDPTGSKKMPITYTDKITVSDPKLMHLLDSLLLDCLGKNLVESLSNNVEVIFSNRSGAGVQKDSEGNVIYPITHVIELKSDENRPFVLMEELIHTYQKMLPNYTNRRLNNEIEAKIGWTLYLKRLEVNLNTQLGAYKNEAGLDAFSFLADYYTSGTSANDPSFRERYEDAVDALRKISGYSNATEYPLSPDYNLNMLKKLMKDC